MGRLFGHGERGRPTLYALNVVDKRRLHLWDLRSKHKRPPKALHANEEPKQAKESSTMARLIVILSHSIRMPRTMATGSQA